MSQAPDSFIRRWQDEVARDPASPSFVPLADYYRSRGRFDVARRVCTRGLARHPENIEAHYLLGRVYRDLGEMERAADEWDIALKLDHSHLPSRRAMGLLRLEEGDRSAAEHHLRLALRADPDDPRVRRALDSLSAGTRAGPLSGAYWDAAAAHVAGPVREFARESRARWVLFIDSSGRILSRVGDTTSLDVAAFASLAAATHAAGREMARMMGQPGFSQLYQGRREHQIFMGAFPVPHGEVLLLVRFDDETNIGLVRSLFREMSGPVTAGWPERERIAEPESLEASLAAGLERLRRQNGEIPHPPER